MLSNEICVVCLDSTEYVKEHGRDIIGINFMENMDTSDVSGKRKKGAQLIKAGSAVCEIVHSNGSKQVLCTAVGGQLLEINDNLRIVPSDIIDKPCSGGFVAILYPNTEVPTLDSARNWEELLSKMKDRTSNKCYQWMRGSCNRGEKCKFEHNVATSEQSGLNTDETAEFPSTLLLELP